MLHTSPSTNSFHLAHQTTHGSPLSRRLRHGLKCFLEYCLGVRVAVTYSILLVPHAPNAVVMPRPVSSKLFLDTAWVLSFFTNVNSVSAGSVSAMLGPHKNVRPSQLATPSPLSRRYRRKSLRAGCWPRYSLDYASARSASSHSLQIVAR